MRNLKVGKNGNSYEIFIDPNINAPGIPAKLVDVCALVNYGNLALLPYPIFDIMIDTLGDQISSLYIKYKFIKGN